MGGQGHLPHGRPFIPPKNQAAAAHPAVTWGFELNLPR
jgi:hypothetical protein